MRKLRYLAYGFFLLTYFATSIPLYSHVSAEETAHWLQSGIEVNATYLLVIDDNTSQNEFPDYIYPQDSLQERLEFWQQQGYSATPNIYNLRLAAEDLTAGESIDHPEKYLVSKDSTDQAATWEERLDKHYYDIGQLSANLPKSSEDLARDREKLRTITKEFAETLKMIEKKDYSIAVMFQTQILINHINHLNDLYSRLTFHFL